MKFLVAYVNVIAISLALIASSGAHQVTSPHHTVQQQNETLCKAGSRQYTGKVAVTSEKSLFFWFFESRSDPLHDPFIIWLNGGPGGSSMFGLFREIGPCLTNSYNNDTISNPHSWTNFANVLFLDQPAGTGFSTARNGTFGGPDNLSEAAEDFGNFIDYFFRTMFPQFSNASLHIAGESFAGRYIPGFTQYLHHTQHLRRAHAPRIAPYVDSIVLVDATVDAISSGALGYYDHLCAHTGDNRPSWRQTFNQTVCEAMSAAVPACERVVEQCRSTYDANLCDSAGASCDDNLGHLFSDEVVEGGMDPYDDRRKCGSNPPFCEDFTGTGYSDYLNLPHVKAALGVSESNFQGINFDLNSRWATKKETNIPTVREVGFILDDTPTRVLVLNGNNDIIVSSTNLVNRNTEGQKRVYDNLPWKNQASYRSHSFEEWRWPQSSGTLVRGGEWKSSGNLLFVSIDEAGHSSPRDQAEAVTFLLKCWTSPQGDSNSRSKACWF
ncbi:unnamed protein product [Clonostachys byssicola]|uniref:carboxypeptidase C n=1 Tax=Clonostachys byssicola TaxID=160290 RepID=A0A9N9Y0T7_9HYPO|nr:unnamed protein product [Clonostachys byssicola]